MKGEVGIVEFLKTHPARYTLGILTFISLFWAVVNYPVMLTLWEYGFDDGTYSHAFLIPFIFIYILYMLANRGELLPRTEIYWPAVASFVVLFVCYYFAIAAQFSLAYWVLSLAVLSNAFWLVVRSSWGLIYALAFLLFMYPMWGALQFLLQHLSVFAVMHIMQLTSIPTYVEGTSVMIPAGTFFIAGGCSGLRYFLVSLAIGSLFVFLNLKRRSSIAKFMTLAIVGALITNWIRIVALILIGHFTDMQSELMTDHNSFGWYIYAPFIFILFWYGEKLYKLESDASVDNTDTASRKVNRTTVIAAVIALFVTSSALQLAFVSEPAQASASCSTEQGDYQIIPASLNAVSVCSSTQTVSNVAFNTLTAQFSGAEIDSKATNYQITPAPEDWQVIQQTVEGNWTLTLAADGKTVHFIASAYQAGEHQVATAGGMKKLRLKNALTGDRRSAYLWAQTACGNRCDALMRNWPALSGQLHFEQQ